LAQSLPARIGTTVYIVLVLRGYQGAQPHGVFWLLFDVEK